MLLSQYLLTTSTNVLTLTVSSNNSHILLMLLTQGGHKALPIQLQVQESLSSRVAQLLTVSVEGLKQPYLS
uniref:Uncharacterized protein n=1 Tax=uncultured marine virus TaxID=186617 RepID=A0A0F7L1D3_9VIRU|nr:hypothetical protein [uncultured marine virus]